ncbi:unnamed protein product [Heligmosomoides polygyrus]|uniref:Endo/exonuclease/phosphatase domain-containing protein n=1 Tax=Heligmosomoides polygyrus TaxID=6339 RepID=A0A3P8CMU2_HELPZ|nr:unnamed protein product [Heligmosomoides polygyrus]
MTICTYNDRTLASEVSVEDLTIQARKVMHDVIGLTETRRHQPLQAAYDSGEELFLGTCNSRELSGPNRTSATEAMWLRISLVFVACAPKSDYGDEGVEAIYIELEEFYKKDHTFHKVVVGDFNAEDRATKVA